MKPGINAAVDGCAELGADAVANGDRDVIQAANGDGKVVSVGLEARKGGDDEVLKTEQISHVDRQRLDDDLCAE